MLRCMKNFIRQSDSLSGSNLSPRNIKNIPAGQIFAFRDFNKTGGS